MKTRLNNYKVVNKLHPKAISVNALSKELDVSTAHIYKMYKKGQLIGRGWDLVVFQDYNFAIPVK